MQTESPPKQPLGFIERVKSFVQSSIGIVLILGVVASLILPYLLTQFYWGVSFDNTGQVGDTIGGIAGPILNITGLIIVYLSFQQQLHANTKQWDAFELEQKKTRREEEFNDIERAIGLLSEDVKNHKPTFRAVAELINEMSFWDTPSDESDILRIKELQQATWFDWRGKQVTGPEVLWGMFSDFDWLANYLETQYESIMKEINESPLSLPRRRLLKASLRNKCMLPTYKWLPDSVLTQLWERDSTRFQDIRITTVMNQLRVDTPMIFPVVIQPFKSQN